MYRKPVESVQTLAMRPNVEPTGGSGAAEAFGGVWAVWPPHRPEATNGAHSILLSALAMFTALSLLLSARDTFYSPRNVGLKKLHEF